MVLLVVFMWMGTLVMGNLLQDFITVARPDNFDPSISIGLFPCCNTEPAATCDHLLTWLHPGWIAEFRRSNVDMEPIRHRLSSDVHIVRNHLCISSASSRRKRIGTLFPRMIIKHKNIHVLGSKIVCDQDLTQENRQKHVIAGFLLVLLVCFFLTCQVQTGWVEWLLDVFYFLVFFGSLSLHVCVCVWPVWKDVKLLQAGGSSRVQSLLPTKTLWYPWWCTVWSTVCTCSYFKTWWSTNVWFSSFGFRVGKAVVSNTHGT